MNYAYIARCDSTDSTFSRCYVIKYIDVARTARLATARHALRCRLSDVDPPVRRRRANGQFSWDYSNEPMSTQAFHRAYPHIRLKPGEGPILVDLDDIATERTSKHPEA